MIRQPVKFTVRHIGRSTLQEPVMPDQDDDDFGACEGCSAAIRDGDAYTHDWDSGVYLCAKCSPTWQDFQDHPENFWRGDEGEHHTAETARPHIEAHLAAGGSLSDSMARK